MTNCRQLLSSARIASCGGLRAVAVCLGLVVAASAPAVHAAPDEDSRLAAQTLFDEAQALKRDGSYEEACEKFAASQKLDPALGTQLNLADCYERVGRTASAWINYVEVAAKAKKAGSTRRLEIAKERAAALKPKLSRMRVEVSSPVDGLTVERAGKKVPEATWGSATPVDPGSYEVTASAPGKKTWRTEVEVEGEGAEVVVEVPALQDVPAGDDAVESQPSEPDQVEQDGTAQTVAGIIIGVVGLGGVGLGAAFAGISHSKYDESLEHCTVSDDVCSPEGVELRDEAQTGQVIYVTSFAVGGAALVTGLVLLLTAPSGDEPGPAAGEASLRWMPTLGPGGAALQLSGQF